MSENSDVRLTEGRQIGGGAGRIVVTHKISVDQPSVNQMTSYHGAVFLNIMVSSPWTSKILQEGPACSPFFKIF